MLYREICGALLRKEDSVVICPEETDVPSLSNVGFGNIRYNKDILVTPRQMLVSALELEGFMMGINEYLVNSIAGLPRAAVNNFSESFDRINLGSLCYREVIGRDSRVIEIFEPEIRAITKGLYGGKRRKRECVSLDTWVRVYPSVGVAEFLSKNNGYRNKIDLGLESLAKIDPVLYNCVLMRRLGGKV